MFDKLKKKSIEIICPACKGGQTEPSLAFSTYCRNCGEHLKIIKGIARLNSGPQLSGLSTIRVVSETIPTYPSVSEKPSNRNGTATTNEDPDTWVKTKAKPSKKKERKKGKRKRAREKSLLEKKKKSQEHAESNEPEAQEPLEAEPATSVAEAFGLTDTPESDEVITKEPEPEPEDYELGEGSITLGDQATNFNELTSGSMAAMIGDLVEHEEKREQAKAAKSAHSEESEDSGPAEITTETPSLEKEEPKPKSEILEEVEKPVATTKEVSKNQIRVRCFRCNHRQWESKHAESTQCGRCNTYISLADYHIRQPTDRVIRTRGNVTIHRRGSLIGSELACRDLLAMGSVSTRIDCSGEARFKYSASVNGNLYCETLIVEKGTIVEFSEGVYTESVKIFGTLRGDVTCAGLVEVTRTGILDGDVTARDVDLQEGGTLTGEMTIDSELKVKLPEVKGYDPSIID